jgi:hypothetical protein
MAGVVEDTQPEYEDPDDVSTVASSLEDSEESDDEEADEESVNAGFAGNGNHVAEDNMDTGSMTNFHDDVMTPA